MLELRLLLHLLPPHLLHLQLRLQLLLPLLQRLLLRLLTAADANLTPGLGQPARLAVSVVDVLNVGTRRRWLRAGALLACRARPQVTLCVDQPPGCGCGGGGGGASV